MKKNKTICLDDNIISWFDDRKYNFSGFCNEFLSNYIAEQEKKKEEKPKEPSFFAKINNMLKDEIKPKEENVHYRKNIKGEIIETYDRINGIWVKRQKESSPAPPQEKEVNP